jgi:hypothetical protein
MPFSPNSLSCPKKLSSEYQPDACGNFSGHSSMLEKIAILGQPPRGTDEINRNYSGARMKPIRPALNRIERQSKNLCGPVPLCEMPFIIST